MKRSELDAIAAKVRNWGRWGEADQRGTLNHIDPQVLRAAAAGVASGRLFSLGLNFDTEGPQRNVRRFNPRLYVTEVATPLNPASPDYRYSDDVISMPLQAATQWDALAHAHYDGVLYNGCKACDTLSEKGAARLGIENLAQPGIMARGVLLDIARLKKAVMLEPGYEITVDDLNAAAAQQNLEVRAGDIVLVRTGHIRRFTVERSRSAFHGAQPGVSPRAAEWIHDKSLAAICADKVAVEVITPERWGAEVPLPLHMLCLRDMGCPLGEMFNLEALAEDCAADGRYEFLLAAPPLAFTRAVGSPVNPLALK